MGTEEQETGPEGFEKFASQALRRNKIGSYEQLLCQHLIKSVASEPIEKIRLVAEAAYMIPETPVDKDTLDLVYSVVTSLSQTRKDMMDPYEKWHHSITWDFPRTPENFEKYILPWLVSWDGVVSLKFSYADRDDGKEFDELEFGPRKFWWASNRIHVIGLAKIEARFMTWAIPQVMIMFEQLSKLVNPDLYDSILDKMRV